MALVRYGTGAQDEWKGAAAAGIGAIVGALLFHTIAKTGK
jgi:hypothetical protein